MRLFTATLIASAWLAFDAGAATVSLGGTVIPGEGLGTSVAGATQETFNTLGVPSVNGYRIRQDNFGSIGYRLDGPEYPYGLTNFGNLSGDVLTGTEAYANVTGDSRGQYQRPTGDNSPYISVASQITGMHNEAAGIQIDFTGTNRYIGFYIGSIDEYNYIRFIDSQGNTIFFKDFGTFISGEALTSFMNIPLYSSAYLNFDFTDSPIPRSLELMTATAGIEFDNLAFATSSSGLQAASAFSASVPEPGSLILLGAAAATIGLARRGR